MELVFFDKKMIIGWMLKGGQSLQHVKGRWRVAFLMDTVTKLWNGQLTPRDIGDKISKWATSLASRALGEI